LEAEQSREWSGKMVKVVLFHHIQELMPGVAFAFVEVTIDCADASAR
jgi:hypothetical protein